MSAFRDAHPSVRCDAQVVLKDGTSAQCGRRQSQPYCKFCTQHRHMFREGKVVIDFHTRSQVTTVIDRGKK